MVCCLYFGSIAIIYSSSLRVEPFFEFHLKHVEGQCKQRISFLQKTNILRYYQT